MKIVILCGGGIGFPNGTAPTARVINYARGLSNHGYRVWVLCLGTSEVPGIGILNTAVKGTLESIEFEYSCGTTVRGSSFWRRRWLALKGPFIAGLKILLASRRTQIDATLLYPDTLLTALWFWFVARAIRSVYLLEKSEQPFLHADKNFVSKWYGMIYLSLIYKLFDGIIVISDYLHSYLMPLIRRDACLLKIPILIDTHAFSIRQPAPLPGRYVAYCGTLNESKDGVLTLMRAFALIKDEFADLNLCLIGDSYRDSQIPRFHQHAKELGIESRVIFTGIIPRDALPGYLNNATILALARPASRQAEAGLATKVGEYLATRNPVVVTQTGELDDYLQDNQSVYFVPPNSVSAFAERLRYAILRPEQSRRIGECGYQIASEYFDYRLNTKRISDLVKDLKSRMR